MDAAPMLKNSTAKKTACLLMLVVYVTVTFIPALNHELWYDEAQAWCVVRDNDLAGIFRVLQYEGHPPLWYLVIYPFAKLGAPCTVMPFISWAVSCVTVAMILWRAPFGIAVKACAIFSSGFLFYNSVTSRVYCLIPLILLFIAELYPQRRKHPILYGAMIALLANTHVIMCGLVGILGIFMLIDLFTEWKASSKKENVMKLAGLATAACGVLLLVLPLLASLGLNNQVGETDHSAGTLLKHFFGSFSQVASKLFPEGGGALTYLAVNIIAVILVLIILLMRHYRRGIAMTIGFVLFFIVTSQLVFHFMHTTRAAIFLYTLFFIFWISKSTETPRKESRPDTSENNKASGLVGFIVHCDMQYEKSVAVLMSAVMALSAVRAADALVFDIGKEYSLSRSTAEYIESSLPANSVILLADRCGAQFSAYYPEAKLYSLVEAEEITYTLHNAPPEYPDWQKIYHDISQYDNVYLLYTSTTERSRTYDSAIYSAQTECKEYIQTRTADIFKLSAKDLLPYVGTDTTVSSAVSGIIGWS